MGQQAQDAEVHAAPQPQPSPNPNSNSNPNPNPDSNPNNPDQVHEEVERLLVQLDELRDTAKQLLGASAQNLAAEDEHEAPLALALTLTLLCTRRAPRLCP